MSIEALSQAIIDLQDAKGCWNVEHSQDNYGPRLTYYVPNYTSTLWTMILLADIEADPNNPAFQMPLKTIAEHFWDDDKGIFTIGKSHFPIPCLNGNMIYLLKYFNGNADVYIERVLDFFSTYQRFDDGDYKTPKDFPYMGNKSCFGAHTCYWGVVKLLKGLSFIPAKERSEKANKLLDDCIRFVLLHRVCYSSHQPDRFIHPMISKITFPNMYKADFLEILWLLKREGIQSDKMASALNLLQEKRKKDGTWSLERQVKPLTVAVTKTKFGNELVTKRALEVTDYYEHKKPGV